jgi:hypothetical protein
MIVYAADTGIVFTMPDTASGEEFLWTVEGALPVGVTAAPASNLTPSSALVFSGDALAAGQSAIRITVHSNDHRLLVLGAGFTIVVVGSSDGPPVVEPLAMIWFANAPDEHALTAFGGTTPYDAWSVEGLPAGVSLDSRTGVLSGTATDAGSYQLSVTVTDAIGRTGSGTITLTVTPLTLSLFAGSWSGMINDGAPAGERLSLQIDELGMVAQGALGETIVATPTQPLVFSLSPLGEFNGIVPAVSWHLVCQFVPPDLVCLGHSLTMSGPPVSVVLGRAGGE